MVISTGNKIEPELDFQSAGEFGLFLKRTYNWYWNGYGLFGKHWVSNFDYKLTFGTSAVNNCYPRPGGGKCGIGSNTVIWAHRPDGRMIKYLWNATSKAYLEQKASAISKIVKQSNGSFILYGEGNSVEVYSSAGYVAQVKNEQGIGWTYSYDASGTYPTRITHTSGRYIGFTWSGGQLRVARDPAGNYYGYAYHTNRFGTGQHLLAATSRPGQDYETTTYHYEDARYAGALTGKSFNGVRYSKFTYDANKYAISSEHNGKDKYAFTYTPGSNGLLTVLETNPLGKQATYTFQNGKLMSVVGKQSPHCDAANQSVTYDANGYPDVETDFNGNKTKNVYNGKGQLLSVIEAYGRPAGSPEIRETRYTWDAGRNRVATIELVGIRKTSYAYTADNRIAKIVEQDLTGVTPSPGHTRTTLYTYTKHPNGLLATVTVDGPLAGTVDSTRTTYSAAGDLVSIQNGLGHKQMYSNHTRLGFPRTVTGANGAVTTLAYDAQGRLIAKSDKVGSQYFDTTWLYDQRGLLLARTLPDNTTRYFHYDAQRRMVAEFEREAAGTYAYRSHRYDNASNVLQTDHWRLNGAPADPYPYTPAPAAQIKGYIDNVTSGTTSNVTGWACASGRNQSIAVHLYVGGAAGAPGATAIGGYMANLASEPQVAQACSAAGMAYRYSIPLSDATRQAHGNKRIYVHGISPVGGSNLTLAHSGDYVVPPIGGSSQPPPPPEPPEPCIRYCDDYPLVVTDPMEAPSGTEMTEDEAQASIQSAAEVDAGEAFHAELQQAVPGDLGPEAPLYAGGDESVPEGMPVEPVEHPMQPGDVPSGDEMPPLDEEGADAVVAGTTGTLFYSVFVDYDELNRPIAMRGNNGQKVVYAYDYNGNVTTITDSLNGITKMTYDALDRLATSTDAKLGKTSFTYNDDDRLVKVVDPRGRTTSYVYDGFGQLWTQISPDTGTTRFAYQATGLRTSMTRHDAKVTTYGYDGLGRLTSSTTVGGTQSFTYDNCTNGRGQLCKVTDPTGSVAYTYTQQGQLWTQTTAFPSNGSSTQTYTYDGMGRPTGVTHNSASTAIAYTYAYGRLSSVKATLAGTTRTVASGFAYQPFGPATGWTYGNGLTRGYNYDLDGRLRGISVKNGSTVLQSLTYGYTANDVIATIVSFPSR